MDELSKLQEALDNTNGRTPKEVLDSFIPKGKKVGGALLVDITFGHGLFLDSIGHPLSIGNINDWGPQDIAMALFAFTRSSRTLNKLVKEDQLEDSLYEFLEEIPFSEIESAATILIAHYFGAMKSIVEMSPPKGSDTQKKTPSDGSSQT